MMDAKRIELEKKINQSLDTILIMCQSLFYDISEKIPSFFVEEIEHYNKLVDEFYGNSNDNDSNEYLKIDLKTVEKSDLYSIIINNKE